MDKKKLCRKALDAAKNAYSPYSNFLVGAALLTRDGRVYVGCNVENSSYSLTNCAERTAFFKAVSEGEREFSAIAVAGIKDGKIQKNFYPCGACRQVISEFCSSDFSVLVVNGEEDYEEHTLSELLPFSFGLKK